MILVPCRTCAKNCIKNGAVDLVALIAHCRSVQNSFVVSGVIPACCFAHYVAHLCANYLAHSSVRMCGSEQRLEGTVR